MTQTAEKTVREIALKTPPACAYSNRSESIIAAEENGLSKMHACTSTWRDTVLNLLTNPETLRSDESEPWTQAPFAALTAHIIDRHHAFVRTESVRLGALTGHLS